MLRADLDLRVVLVVDLHKVELDGFGAGAASEVGAEELGPPRVYVVQPE
jgi:hypothetical protein